MGEDPAAHGPVDWKMWKWLRDQNSLQIPQNPYHIANGIPHKTNKDNPNIHSGSVYIFYSLFIGKKRGRGSEVRGSEEGEEKREQKRRGIRGRQSSQRGKKLMKKQEKPENTRWLSCTSQIRQRDRSYTKSIHSIIQGWRQFLQLQRPNGIITRVHYHFQVGIIKKISLECECTGNFWGTWEWTNQKSNSKEAGHSAMNEPWAQRPCVSAATRASELLGKTEHEAKTKAVAMATDSTYQIPCGSLIYHRMLGFSWRQLSNSNN